MNQEFYMMLQRQSSPIEEKKSNTTRDFSDISEDLATIASMNSSFTLESRDKVTTRKSRYQKHWDFYNGNHWDNPFYDGEKKAVFNFCKTIVDKGCTWFLAKGWKVKAREGNEEIAKICNDVWDENDRSNLTLNLLQFGSVTGDGYLYVTLDAGTQDAPKPREDWKVKIQVLDPESVFPVWSSENPGEMDAVVITFEMFRGRDKFIRSIFIAKNYFQVWENEQLLGTYDNLLGEIPVVHFSNFPLAYSNYGKSDIEDVIPINEEYNSVANSIKRTINYHAEPTTLIFGAKASTLERGANKVWSGLPTDAKVQNLQLDTDMEGTYRYLEQLEGLIYKLGETPKIAFDSHEVAVSNTSGLTMQMMFQPLIEKTRRRRETYTPGFKSVNRLILKFHATFMGTNLESFTDEPESVYETRIEYTSPLPKDEQQELDSAIKKVESGIWSKAEAIRRVSGVTDEARLAIELAADKREALSMDYEKQKALEVMPPNLSAVFLGSPYLSQPFEDLSKGSLKIEASHSKKVEPLNSDTQ